jgi:hypothetical protein
MAVPSYPAVQRLRARRRLAGLCIDCAQLKRRHSDRCLACAVKHADGERERAASRKGTKEL